MARLLTITTTTTEEDRSAPSINTSLKAALDTEKGVPVVIYGNAFLNAINFLLESIAKQRLINRETILCFF